MSGHGCKWSKFELFTHARCSECGQLGRAQYDLPEDVGMPLLVALERVVLVLADPSLALDPRPGRWLERTSFEHTYVALSHAVAYLRGKDDCDHLAHAGARILLAIARREK